MSLKSIYLVPKFGVLILEPPLPTGLILHPVGEGSAKSVRTGQVAFSFSCCGLVPDPVPLLPLAGRSLVEAVNFLLRL